MRLNLGVVVLTLVGLQAASPALAEMDEDKLRSRLTQLQEDNLWGEVVLEEGRIRAIKVDSLAGDNVAVREILGAFQERTAVYPLAEIRSLRELGAHRISLRRAPYRTKKSLLTSMVAEILVPGGGYFYIGESRQGLALLLFSSAAVGTGVATGESGAAGWAPIVTWIKIASLLHLYDEVRAMNAAHREGLSVDLMPAPEAAGLAWQVRYSF